MNKKKQYSVNKIVIVTLLFMMLGTSLELYLINHFEGIWQLIPLLCIATSLIVLLILIFYRSLTVLITFKVLMVTTALAGFLGIYLHLKENFEFEQEMVPSLSNWQLLIESLSGALPTLAPASLIVLALIGYIYIKLIKQQTHEI